MKPRNLGHVRARQRKHEARLWSLPQQHMTSIEGEPFCGHVFSHSDVGFKFIEVHPVRHSKFGTPYEPEVLRCEPEEIICPRCGREVRNVVPFLGESFWETKEKEDG